MNAHSVILAVTLSAAVHTLAGVALNRAGAPEPAPHAGDSQLLALSPAPGAEALTPPPEPEPPAASVAPPEPEPEPTPPSPPPPPPLPLPIVTAGIDGSTAEVEAWKGFAEATEHSAPKWVHDQSGITRAPGLPSPPQPEAAPQEPTPQEPASPEQASPEQAPAEAPARSESATPPAPALPAPEEPAPDRAPAEPVVIEPVTVEPTPVEPLTVEPGPLAEPLPERESEAPDTAPDAASDTGPGERHPELPSEEPAEQPAEQTVEITTERVVAPVELDPGSWYALAYAPQPPQAPLPRPIAGARPESVPNSPSPNPPAPSLPASAQPVPPSPAAPMPAADQREPGVLGDDESAARSANETLVVRPGRTLARAGLQIRTAHLRLDSTTRLFGNPRDPVVRVTFGRNGRVLLAEFVEGRTTGNPAIDKPLLDSLHRWSASGEDLLRIPTDDPGAGLTLVFRIDF